MSNIQQFKKTDVQIIEQHPLFDGFFKMIKYRFRHRLFAGGWSQPIEREIFERGDAVAVLPYDPALNEFVLIEQIRIGALPSSETPWLLEIVAGMIDKQESAEQVCVREAEEEAGLKLLKLCKALSYLSSPGGTTERLHIFIALVDASNAGGNYGLDNENEDILVHRVDADTALDWCNSGKIDNAATLIALQWFALNKKRVLEEFSGEQT